MAASVFSSAVYGKLFDPGEAGRLFSDTAEVRAMLVVLGALARVQGRAGTIPEISGEAIHRASLELQIDPGGLGAQTRHTGVPVPALIAALRTEMQAPEHAQYLHWGATSQDIMDTALMLRLRQALGLAETRVGAVLAQLADQAEAHAHTPCPARTYGQIAVPSSWGAVLAQWGAPLLAALGALGPVRAGLCVSLSGAAGTASALGPDAAQTRAALAGALGLQDPGRSWHTDRAPVRRIADWQCDVIAACATLGQGVIGLAAQGEVTLDGGASSTMPHKQNPVGPSILVALNAAAGGLRGTLQSASAHQHQRDGAAWFSEWMTVPQLALGCAAALEQAVDITAALTPQPAAMRAALGGLGLAHAEALSFALAAQMPRAEAQAAASELCRRAQSTGTPLQTLAQKAYPSLSGASFAPDAMGHAPHNARAFAKSVRACL